MAWQDLTTLYRGQPWSGPSLYLQLANKGIPTIMGGSGTGLSAKELGRLAGQYWTQDADLAAHYAGNTGQIRSIKVPTNYIDKFNKFQKRVTSLPSGKYTLAEAAGGHLVPKSTLQKYPSKLNLGKTLVNYMSRKDYPGKLLKAGWDIMGEGYTVGDKIGELGKNISKAGLGYLKNNALRALTTLGSLPAQAGLMTLYSTPLGADDMPTGDAEQEYFDYYNQYGDSYGDLKIPGWRKRKMDKLATQKGIDQVGMQQKIQQAQAAQQAAAVQQVRQNIQTYGNRDRPNVGINRPGGGRGQSPTGGDVAGTPFARGGILGAF